MSAPLLLPSSFARKVKTFFVEGLPYERVYCASCGKLGPLVMTVTKDFAFYLCDDDAQKYGTPDGMYAVPDDVFAERVKQEQLEKFGRILAPAEMDEVLNDPHSTLAKLAKERPV